MRGLVFIAGGQQAEPWSPIFSPQNLSIIITEWYTTTVICYAWCVTLGGACCQVKLNLRSAFIALVCPLAVTKRDAWWTGRIRLPWCSPLIPWIAIVTVYTEVWICCNDCNMGWSGGITNSINMADINGVGCSCHLARDGRKPPREEVHPQKRSGDVSRGRLCLAYPVVHFWGLLMTKDTCLDPGASQNFATTTVIYQASHFFRPL